MKNTMIAAALAVALFSTQVAMAGAFQNKVSRSAIDKNRTTQRKYDKMKMRGDLKTEKTARSAAIK